MRFAAIADIHGNYDALAAVLADIAGLGVTEVVNLGDHVSGPLEAGRTADLLMAKRFPTVQGDQDRRILEHRAHGGGSYLSGSARLDDSHVAWLAGLPATLVYQGEVLLCHGSPRNDAAYWLDRVTSAGVVATSAVAEIEAEANGTTAGLILCGHTHIPRVVRLRDGRLVVNAGSVGLPGYRGAAPIEHVVETGTPDACYALLERGAGGWRATIRYVPYDCSRMAALAARNGYPDWARAIATGWVR